MSQSRTLYIGLDVHKDSIAVAYVAEEHGAEVTELGTIGTRQCDIDQLVRKLHATAKHLVFVDEAGPCGYWLSRYLTKKGHHCWVVAPSLMPNQAGDRVNTDRRDAIQLARLMRSGDLTPVSGPAVEDEAIRDLSRARGRRLSPLSRPPSFVSKPCCSTMRSAIWVARPGARPISRWLAAVVCATPAQHLVFQAYVRAVHEHTTRLQRLVQELAGTGHILASAPGGRGPCGPAWRAVHRGCDPRGRARRPARASENPRQLMKYLGLIPSAYSSGERRRQGSITKAGNTHARRALVEGAWAYRYPAEEERPVAEGPL